MNLSRIINEVILNIIKSLHVSTFYIVATPIGNLEDITLRALRVLKEVSLILCEDTRVTRKLLEHYGITTQVMSYHQHSGDAKRSEVMKLLVEGNDIALVTDAGTPGVSDPGNELVGSVVGWHFFDSKLGDRSVFHFPDSFVPPSEWDSLHTSTKLPRHEMSGSMPASSRKGQEKEYPAQEVSIIPIPGPSALTTALSIAGVSVDEFLFLGFLPHKKGRQTLLKEIATSKRSVVLYESKYRIVKLLEELEQHECGDRGIVVCRELTKKFETVYRGRVAEVAARLNAQQLKGEFVVIISGLR